MSESILAFATKGAGTNEEQRLRGLLERHDVRFFPYDHARKLSSFWGIICSVRRRRPRLLVMEGTGVAGGMACLLSRIFFGVRYVFSSGDAIGPYIRSRSLVLAPLFDCYERVLCALCEGFIGWTPYLVGRALTFGARRAMTAPGWAQFQKSDQAMSAARHEIRAKYGFADSDIVFGIVGSLFWSGRAGYCYGYELVQAAVRCERPGVKVLVCGAGSGMERLRRAAGPRLDHTIFLPGAVPWERVIDHLAAMDVGSLPQSADKLGSFRYTTKISEYIAAKLPIVIGQLPLAYDLDEGGWMWRLSARLPWSQKYIRSMAQLMEDISREEIERRRAAIPHGLQAFDREKQIDRATRFIGDVLSDLEPHKAESRRARTGVCRAEAGNDQRTLSRDQPRAQSRPANTRLKLLSIAHSYAVANNRRLIHEMNRAGGGRWEVSAIAPRYFHGAQDLRPVHFEPMADEPNRVEALPAKFTRFVHIFSYDARLKEILSEGWDFVHAWEEPYIYVGWQIARWTPPDTPLVYRTAQSLHKYYPPPFGWMEQYNMRRAAGWICSGRLVAQTLGSREIYKHRPMCLIPLGVDLEQFKPDAAARAAILQKLGWDDAGPPVVGYLGRFVRAKGLHLLMSVLDDLDTPWRAMFVGAGPAEGELRRWAARHGERVRVCNDVRHADVPSHINAMDIMCAPSQTTPSWREQFGRMLIEAFACGVPVVGSDSGEIPYVIEDAGTVCGERDQAAWIGALRTLIHSPELRADHARRGLERVRERYAWPVVGRAHVKFFTEILDSRSR